MTETELLYQIEQCQKWHNAIKEEAIGITKQIEELEIIANEKIKQLENIEKNYVDYLRELTSRQ